MLLSAERGLVNLPLMVRLKQPSLSPDKESAPHCRTTALGWYISITLAMIYTNNNTHSLKCFHPSGDINYKNIIVHKVFTYRFEYGFI